MDDWAEQLTRAAADLAAGLAGVDSGKEVDAQLKGAAEESVAQSELGQQIERLRVELKAIEARLQADRGAAE
jgi:hypothetical protein